VLQHSDSVFRDSRICSSQFAGHTEAYAVLQDALWFALSLVLRRQKSRSKLE